LLAPGLFGRRCCNCTASYSPAGLFFFSPLLLATSPCLCHDHLFRPTSPLIYSCSIEFWCQFVVGIRIRRFVRQLHTGFFLDNQPPSPRRRPFSLFRSTFQALSVRTQVSHAAWEYRLCPLAICGEFKPNAAVMTRIPSMSCQPPAFMSHPERPLEVA
jgi:hypothetical protein